MKLLTALVLISLAAQPLFAANPSDTAADTFSGRTENWPRQVLQPGQRQIVLNVNIPKGFHATKEAPITFEWRSDDSSVVRFTKSPAKYDFSKLTFPIMIPLKAKIGKGEIIIDASIFFCKDKSTVCQFDNVRLKIPVVVDNSGKPNLSVTIDAVARGSKEDF